MEQGCDGELNEDEASALAGIFPTLTLNPMLVTEEQLKLLSGYSRRADLKKWLDVHGIWYTSGKDGRLGTTVPAISRAGLQHASDDEFVFK
jgi:hypothetical protein